jgi:hypothetical protein
MPMNDMLSKKNNLKPPDEAALRAAIRDHAGWDAIHAAYNAETGEDRSLSSLKSFAWRLRIKITPAMFGPATAWNDELLARIMDSKASYFDAVRCYNSATGEQRSEQALKARWARLADLRRKGKTPKPRAGSVLPPIECHREIQLRIQRIGLYRDCFGIPDRMLTPKEFAEAMSGDPDNWPDAPAAKAGHLDCSGRERPARVYRVSGLKGRAS